MSNTTGPVLKYPGSKWRMADWIIQHMPPHTTYLEPFFGSGAVLFNKTQSRIEVINDIDGNVVNLFRVIRERPAELAKAIEFTPWAREEYCASTEITGDKLENARRFLVRCWQAYGVRTNIKTGWRSDIQGRRGMYCVNQWNTLPDRVLTTAGRLKGVQIESQDAIKLVKRYCYDNILIYADPPYPLQVRAGELYSHEMTDDDHLELLDALDEHPGPVLLSGYACQLYDERLHHWERKTARAWAEGGRQREEVLWINPVAAREIGKNSLFWGMMP